MPTTALRMTLHGQVQGVGLRPAVVRLAEELQLSGFVRNAADGVQLQVEGDAVAVDRFQRELSEHLASIARVSIADVTSCEASGAGTFQIVASLTSGPLATRVPRDLAACPACLQDVLSEADRRSGYPFASCTNCGPRYSIIDALPYDRCRTSMTAFDLCPACCDEFTSPGDRRFHAQTNACLACGPSLALSRPDGCGDVRPYASAGDKDAVAIAAEAVLAGKVLALRGLGGYQLIVDATNPAANARLRERKRRPLKPLAVMVRSLADAGELAVLSEAECETLAAPSNPIVLVTARSDRQTKLDEGIHPGLRELGLFLPTTPLHRLLLERVGGPLVVTSGNVDGDPLAVEPSAAERDLSGVADVWLHHDRPIVRPIDDSVVRVIANRPVTIRNARGLAPVPLPAIERFTRQFCREHEERPSVLAVGGHQKQALALFNGQQAVLGPHLGDLDSLASRQRFVQQVEQLQSLFRCDARLIVHDRHPDYFTTRWAEASGTETLAVQHHHAHVVTAMIDNDWLDREVLGVAFDGTGYGPDGTVWGGEFLRATVHGFERVAHLRPFRLPGGETAVREPWRAAASLLYETSGLESVVEFLSAPRGLNTSRVRDPAAVAALVESQLAPLTTSAGRLFDGVASLILDVESADFEGQPAMLLESAADISNADACGFEISETSPLQIDWRPMVRQLLADRQQQCSTGLMAAKFHHSLARAIADVAQRFELPVVLTGGVFQNRLLTERVLDELAKLPREVGRHTSIPPNDGGLAAGQLAIGLAWLNRFENPKRQEKRC